MYDKVVPIPISTVDGPLEKQLTVSDIPQIVNIPSVYKRRIRLYVRTAGLPHSSLELKDSYLSSSTSFELADSSKC